jgi:transcriptional regulator NrdR family protein
MSTRSAKRSAPVFYGLYEAEETPRYCPGCLSSRSRIVSKWEVPGSRRRKRVCAECGRLFTTRTATDTRFIEDTKQDARFI